VRSCSARIEHVSGDRAGAPAYSLQEEAVMIPWYWLIIVAMFSGFSSAFAMAVTIAGSLPEPSESNDETA
jgi:hypothetical protein